MLEAIGLEKRFGKQVLFEQFSFQLPNQGLMLLTGPSGSGKTTLLRILQLNETFIGRLRFDGIELTLLNRQQQNHFRRQYLSSVDQEVELIPHASVKDHLEIMKHIKGHYIKPSVNKFIQQFLNEVHPLQTIRSLSRGQQQRLAILLACIGQTKILLLDEPTTGLDLKNRKRIYEFLRVIKHDQLVIISSHQALDDGMTIDGHLDLSNLQKSPFIIDKKKARLNPMMPNSKWSFRWFFQFHYRQRKFQIYRKRIYLFQTFVFVTIGVMISLIMLIGNEIIRITDTMLGGQYQYVKPHLQEEKILKSTDEFDPIFNTLPISHQLRSYYDENYFEYLKPYHRFYLEHHGFQLTIKDFHLGLINFVETPMAIEPTFNYGDFKEDDLMLGLQNHHLRLLAQTLNCFPTLNAINIALVANPISIYLRVHVPEWQYQDQIQFTLKRIALTDTPRWFHPSINYPKTIYEDRMRLPTRGVEELYEFQPWRIVKTTIIKVQNDETFLKLWQRDDAWQIYHLQKHPSLGWKVYKTQGPRNRFPRFKANEQNFHYHSKYGYHYYPHQKLSGFAQPLFFNPLPEGHASYLETLRQLKEPFDWLDVTPPLHSSVGYILANPGTSLKLKTNILYESLSLDEVVVSTSLMRRWNLEIGDVVYVDHGIFPELNENGRIFQTKQSALKIVDSVEKDGHWLYHHPHWLSHWLMIQAGVPSYLLEPEAWIFYDAFLTPEGFETIHPLKEVQDSVNEIQHFMIWMLCLWCLLVGMPLLILFFYYSIQSLISDQKQLKTLKGFGAPWAFIQHWYGSKIMVLASEVVIPTIWLLIFMDLLIKHWLGRFFFLSLRYQFPWLTITIFLLFSIGFYLIFAKIQFSVLRRNFKNY